MPLIIPNDTVILQFFNLPSSYPRFHTEKRDNVKPFNVGREDANEWTTEYDDKALDALSYKYGMRVADQIFDRMKNTAGEMLLMYGWLSPMILHTTIHHHYVCC
jgi:hypothetical protein